MNYILTRLYSADNAALMLNAWSCLLQSQCNKVHSTSNDEKKKVFYGFTVQTSSTAGQCLVYYATIADAVEYAPQNKAVMKNGKGI